MKVTNINGVKKEVTNVKKFGHKTFDAKGKKITTDYVQFTVVGKNSTWKDAIRLDKFKKLNPKAKI